MSDYTQFTQALEKAIKTNIKLSHISNLVSKGFNQVAFSVSSKGVIMFSFGGHRTNVEVFNSLDSFYKESGQLLTHEPLGYAITNSSVDAERSVPKEGIPRTYQVILDATSDSTYRCKIKVPREVTKGSIQKGFAQ